MFAARAAMHHHRMAWDEAGGPGSEWPRRGHRHHRQAGLGDEAAGRDGLRLPPRIERMLEAWHAQAHGSNATQGAEPGDAASA
jgi:hypothetical protein